MANTRPRSQAEKWSRAVRLPEAWEWGFAERLPKEQLFQQVHLRDEKDSGTP